MNIYVIVMFCILAVAAMLLLWREKLLDSPRYLICASILVAAAFVIRIICLDHVTYDYRDFLSQWIQYFRDNGGFSALSQPLGNYNLPYLYFLAFFSYLGGYDLYLIKILSIAFDLLLAWSAMKLMGTATDSKGKKLFVFLAVLLYPTVILNGAYWGQCDSIYVAFAVLSVYLALDDHPVAAMIAITCSFAFKLQAVFVMPIFFVLMLMKKIKIRHLFLFPISYLVIVTPALIAGRPFIDTITLYFNQTDSIGTGLNYNSPSIFAFITQSLNETTQGLLGHLGIAAAFLSILLIFVWMIRKRVLLSNHLIILICALLSVCIPFLLPRMHDRYFFAADIFTLIVSVMIPRYFSITLLTGFASLLGYHAYLKMRYLLPMKTGAMALIVAIYLLIAAIFFYLQDQNELVKKNL